LFSRGVADGSRKQPKSLQAKAIGLLARREYSRAELRERLMAGGAPRGDVVAVLDALASEGYLSDERFAHGVVRQKSGAFSQRAIAGALKAKGVTGEAAAEALAGNTVDDQDALVALWRRRFGHAPADERDKARQVRFLQSRGFSLSAIFRLLRSPPESDDGTSDPADA
jgi:regulatory protein